MRGLKKASATHLSDTMVVVLNGCNGWTVSFANHALKLDKAADANAIVSALASNLNAECLNLSGNTLGIDAARPIGIALEKNRFIKRCLFNDLFTGEGPYCLKMYKIKIAM